MQKRRVFLSELAYALGIALLALGTALMEKANFGVSMVVAPAYVLHLRLAQISPAFTFGVAEYMVQALLLVVLSVVLRKFKLSALFSFVTALIYGAALDVAMRLLGGLPAEGAAWRLGEYAVGLLLCATGVAFLFHTYIAPEAYELFVKELAGRYGWRIDRVKTVYDLCSCALGVLLSFLFFGFGRFEGVKLGTVLCALVNGWLIGRIGQVLESAFEFKDGLALRALFNR
ncbi:MAG: hypothetical protein IJ074_12185 [Clostridia bacterium]|nr:hypothetical protein [Clostridia bacterium]